MSTNDSDLTVEELIARLGDFNYRHDQPLWGRYAQMAIAKMQFENIGLTKRGQEISEKQLDVSNRANQLTQEQLASNTQASEQNDKNAKLMNTVTDQLAKSTSSLKWATWVLVLFTAIQAFVALVALYTKKP